MVIQRKVCMLGATAVGKTSLVRRFVESMFSERYQATIGVKIDRKLVELDGMSVSLLLWDLQGEDDLQRVRLSYLRGAAGLIFVADGTRPETLTIARSIQESSREVVGDIPAILVVNKADLESEWRVDDESVRAIGFSPENTLKASAKDGRNVEAAFQLLVRQMAARAS